MPKWYETVNENSDIVVSTRIRLARNLRSLPFGPKMTDAQQRELLSRTKNALEPANLGNNRFDFINLSDLSEFGRYSLAEKHLVSPDFIQSPQNKLLALSQDNAISVMVNEEDHLRIQVLSSGMELENSYKLCDMVDNLLDEQLDYAFDDKLGYLTVCPTNLGTGLRASMMLHLPALTESRLIPQLIKTVNNLGLTIRGTYGEGSNVKGNIYQLSNQVTLGLTEKSAIKNLENVALQIIASERQARGNLYSDGQNVQLTDRIMRSYGILKNARLLSSDEFYELSSDIRLGISLGIIKNSEIKQINVLYQQVGTASICADREKKFTAIRRDEVRAELVRNAV